jgi:hypothetical protein
VDGGTERVTRRSGGQRVESRREWTRDGVRQAVDRKEKWGVGQGSRVLTRVEKGWVETKAIDWKENRRVEWGIGDAGPNLIAKVKEWNDLSDHH